MVPAPGTRRECVSATLARSVLQGAQERHETISEEILTAINERQIIAVDSLAREIADQVLESTRIDAHYLKWLGLEIGQEQRSELLVLNLFFSTAATLNACAQSHTAATNLTDALYSEVYDLAFEVPTDRSAFTDRFLSRWNDYRDFLFGSSRESIRQRTQTLQRNLGIDRSDALLYLTAALSRRTSSLNRALNRVLARLEPVAA